MKKSKKRQNKRERRKVSQKLKTGNVPASKKKSIVGHGACGSNRLHMTVRIKNDSKIKH